MDAGWRPGGSVISHVYQLNARASRYIRQYGRAGPGVSAGYRGSPSHPRVRLPRTVMGLLAGAALAVSGVLMQTVTRNPLASETTLGVNAGAYLAVVAGMIFWPGLRISMPFHWQWQAERWRLSPSMRWREKRRALLCGLHYPG